MRAILAIVEDVERGFSDRLRDEPWQTDTCIGAWHYDRRIFEQHKYKTVIIDTLGVQMDRAEKAFGEKPENKGNKFGKWGDLKIWANDTVRAMHSAPFTSIILTHAVDEKDENTGAVKTVPNIPGGSKKDLPGIPDIIGYMTLQKTEEGAKRVLIVDANDRLVTKNRFNLPAVIVEPSMKKITTLIKESGEKK